MTSKTYRVKGLLLTFVVALLLFQNSSGYDGEGLQEAAGRYLGAARSIEALQRSSCSYVVQEKYSADKVIEEVSSALQNKDREEFNKFLSSKEWIDSANEFDKIIDQLLTGFVKQGLDQKTACGMVLSVVLGNFAKQEQIWQQAKSLP